MMSPMALSRTISRLLNRGVAAGKEKELVILVSAPIPMPAVSRFSRPQPRLDNVCGGMILWITDDDDAASTSFDYIALGDALCRVVGALGMKIRMDFANDGAHVLFRKNNDGVHIGQRRQNFRAFFGRHHGPPFTLQCAHGSIGAHRDNQFAAEFPRGTQVSH